MLVESSSSCLCWMLGILCEFGAAAQCNTGHGKKKTGAFHTEVSSGRSELGISKLAYFKDVCHAIVEFSWAMEMQMNDWILNLCIFKCHATTEFERMHNQIEWNTTEHSVAGLRQQTLTCSYRNWLNANKPHQRQLWLAEKSLRKLFLTHSTISTIIHYYFICLLCMRKIGLVYRATEHVYLCVCVMAGAERRWKPVNHHHHHHQLPASGKVTIS